MKKWEYYPEPFDVNSPPPPPPCRIFGCFGEKRKSKKRTAEYQARMHQWWVETLSPPEMPEVKPPKEEPGRAEMIAVTDLKPGDTIIVTLDEFEYESDLADGLRECFPEVNVLERTAREEIRVIRG